MPKPNPRFSRKPKREAGFRKLEARTLDRLAVAPALGESLISSQRDRLEPFADFTDNYLFANTCAPQ
jgi:hypothetical protein